MVYTASALKPSASALRLLLNISRLRLCDCRQAAAVISAAVISVESTVLCWCKVCSKKNQNDLVEKLLARGQLLSARRQEHFYQFILLFINQSMHQHSTVLAADMCEADFDVLTMNLADFGEDY